MTLCHLTAILTACLLLAPATTLAKIPHDTIKIGVLQDLPQPFASQTGNGGLVAAQLAASDFATEHLKGDAEILPGVSGGSEQSDLHQVQDWLDKEHVAAVVSSSGLAIDRKLARLLGARHRTLLVATANAGVSDQFCAANTVIWGSGPVPRARALAQVLIPRDGKRWFILGEQDPAGLAQRAALHDAVSAMGADVVGEVEQPVGSGDLSKVMPKLSQVQAQVLALAQGEGALTGTLRHAQLAELRHRVTIAAPSARIGDIDHAGPRDAAGLVVVAPFYWDTDDRTRRFARRWSERMHGRHVTENAVAVYAATLSFLQAAKAVDDVDADKVLVRLRQASIKDTLFGTVTVRSDGWAVHDLTVYRVKPPNQVQRRWDYYAKMDVVPGDRAFPDPSCRTTAGR